MMSVVKDKFVKHILLWSDLSFFLSIAWAFRGLFKSILYPCILKILSCVSQKLESFSQCVCAVGRDLILSFLIEKVSGPGIVY